MKNLKYYEGDPFNFHESVIENKYTSKDDPSYKERVKRLSSEIKPAFDRYKAAFDNNTLEGLESIGYSGQNKLDLQELYSYKSTKLQKLLQQVTTTPTNRKRSVCANCTISEINSFDHTLPQMEFSEFTVNPLNLIPSCTNCNSRKSKYWVKDGSKLFLNLYVDLIPEMQFLFAKIDVKSHLDMEIEFYLFKPPKMEDKLFELIQSHYSKLKLFKRFLDNADDVVSEFENEINPYLKKLSKKDIAECVIETIEANKALFGRNFWKCVLKETLLNDEKFMNRFEFIR